MVRILVALPFLLVLVLFALSNTQPVQFGLWPTDMTIEAPVALAVLAAMAIAFLVGTALLWANVLGARLRARRAEHAARALEKQVTALQAELEPLRARVGRPGTSLVAGSWRG